MKWIFAIVALTAILAAGLHLSENVSRFDAPGPSPKTTVIPSPPVRLSKMTFPISVPIATVADMLERKVPRQPLSANLLWKAS